ncbi:hypothetical protein BH11PSE11_BH11PSE11_17060 [soil metagenome]
MRRSSAIACLAVCTFFVGCASTNVEITGKVPHVPLCQLPGQSLSALVLWGPQWRADQKEVALRELAAQKGIEAFLKTSACFAKFELRRVAEGGAAVAQSERELLDLAGQSNPRPDRVLVVKVRELGPVVKLFSSGAMVEGATEVVLDLTVVDVPAAKTLAESRTRWQNGGPMVIKGVASLPEDMQAALSAALRPGTSP